MVDRSKEVRHTAGPAVTRIDLTFTPHKCLFYKTRSLRSLTTHRKTSVSPKSDIYLVNKGCPNRD